MTTVHLTPEQVQNTAAGYAELRERPELPHVVLPGLRTPVRLVTRYADVKAALTEPRLVRDRGAIPSEREEADRQDELMEAASAGLPAEYVKYFAGHLALFDGEEHARRRAPLTRAFTARRIAALREFAERTADGLLGEAEQNGGRTDLLGEFAYPLSTHVICELVGVDERDRDQVCVWIRDFAYGDGSRTGEALVGIVEYCKELIARRRAALAEHLISVLVEGARESEDPLSDDELAADQDSDEYGESAEQLDITREFGRDDGHLAFGHGAHYCIGAALGRLVTSVVLDRLFVSRDSLRFAVAREELEFGHWPADGFHLLSLPVTL